MRKISHHQFKNYSTKVQIGPQPFIIHTISARMINTVSAFIALPFLFACIFIICIICIIYILAYLRIINHAFAIFVVVDLILGCAMCLIKECVSSFQACITHLMSFHSYDAPWYMMPSIPSHLYKPYSNDI